MNRILALINIRPGEARMVFAVAAFFAVIEIGRNLAANVVDALFFLRYGVNYLPYLFIGLGITTFFASLWYTAYLGRFNKGRFYSGMIAGMGLLLLIERGLMVFGLLALYPVLWLSAKIIAALLGTILWNVAGDLCDTQQAKRLFPIFVSAGILGSLVGSISVGPGARLLGTENLILVYVLLLVLAVILIRGITRRHYLESNPVVNSSSLIKDIRSSYGYVRRSPLLLRIAISAVLFSILFFTVSFPFGKAAAAAYTNEADLAGFLGIFNGIASTLMFLVALLLANRLYARIGIVTAILLLPVTYLLGFGLWIISFTLATAIIFRLLQMVVLSGIGDGAYSAFFNVVTQDKRAQVRAFDSAVPAQVGTVLSGVLLILGERVLNNSQIFLMGVLVALACGFIVWQMRKSYGDALLDALRAGRVDVFTTGDRIFAGLQQDATAIRMMIAALDDPRPGTQQLAAEILGRMKANSAAPHLIERLGQASDAVKVSFIYTLGKLGAPAAVLPVAGRLSDPSPDVRSAAIEILPVLLPPADPSIPRLVQPVTGDADFTVRIQALTCLAACAGEGSAIHELVDLLDASDSERRKVILRALEKPLARVNSMPDAILVTAIIPCLADASPAVREAACNLLAHMLANDAGLQSLSNCLTDPDLSVRVAAARALRASGQKAYPVVLSILERAGGIDLTAALDALPPGDTTLHGPLRDSARAAIQSLEQWRKLSTTIPVGGRASSLLSRQILQQVRRQEGYLVKLIGLLVNPEAMALVSKSLSAGDAQTRSAAIEALEVLGDKQLVKELIPLLEETSPVGNQAARMDGVFKNSFTILTTLEDRWLKALALRTAGELKRIDLIPDLQRFTGHPDILINGAAQDALAQLEGTMDTLATISLIERVLLLKEIPLFSELSPEDLGQIAQISAERWYTDGEALCQEGEYGNELFIIASGSVQVLKTSDQGIKPLATRTVGEFVGEMSIIDAAPRFATVTAQGEVRALVISSAAFKTILRDRPEVSLAVMRGLSRRLRELS